MGNSLSRRGFACRAGDGRHQKPPGVAGRPASRQKIPPQVGRRDCSQRVRALAPDSNQSQALADEGDCYGQTRNPQSDQGVLSLTDGEGRDNPGSQSGGDSSAYPIAIGISVVHIEYRGLSF